MFARCGLFHNIFNTLFAGHVEVILQVYFSDAFYEMNLRKLLDDQSTFVQVINGLVPPGNKLLPEPKLTHIYVAIWRN